MESASSHTWYTLPLPAEVSDWLAANAPSLVHPQRLNIYGDRVQILALHGKDGAIQAVQVLYRTRIKGLTSLSTPPFCPWTGPFMVLKSQKPVAQLSERKRVLEQSATALEASGLPLVNVVFGPGLNDVQPLVWAGFQATPKYTYQLNLLLTEEELLNQMDAKRRNQIRKGATDGLTLAEVSPKSLQPLVRAHLESKKAFHEPQAFEGLFQTDQIGLRAFEVNENGAVRSWFVFQEDRDQVYYLLGGSSDAGRGSSGSWGMWSCISQFKKEGKHIFDFEGSMIPEVERYFRSFGGELVTHFAVDKQKGLQKVVDLVRRK